MGAQQLSSSAMDAESGKVDWRIVQFTVSFTCSNIIMQRYSHVFPPFSKKVKKGEVLRELEL